MTTSPPAFTAVIRAKDREHTIAKAIESVLVQSALAEVIVVDSGSTDRTVEVAELLGARIISIAPEEFTYGGAINIGVARATAPFVLVLSAHCALPDPSWAHRALKLLEDPLVAGINGFAPSAAAIAIDPEHDAELALELGGTAKLVVQQEPWFGFTGFSNHASMLRRSVAVDFPFDERLRACEDKEWANRVVRAGFHIVYSPHLSVSGLHRRREGTKALFKRAKRESAAVSETAGRPAWTINDARLHAVRLARYRRGVKRFAGLRPAALVESAGRYVGSREVRRIASPTRRSAHTETLAELLTNTKSGRVDLLNFPLHNNCGDSAIWLGQRRLLRSLGVDDRQVRCFTNTLNQFKVADPAPLALVRGGGYFGDLWSDEFRSFLDACNQYRGRSIVFMPQTMGRISPETVAITQRAIAEHGDVTLLFRDRRSLEVAQGFFPQARTCLAPDAAQCLSKTDLLSLGGYPNPRLPAVRIIARSDAEGDGTLVQSARERGLTVLDFVDSQSVLRNRALRYAHEVVRARAAAPLGRALIAGVLPRQSVLDRHAEREVARAVGLILGAERVVTDRLHACVLASALEIPVTAVDTGYGKLTGYFTAWPSPYVSFAADADAALRKVSPP